METPNLSDSTFATKVRAKSYATQEKDGRPVLGLEIDAQMGRAETLPNTTDWHGRRRSVANAGNDYLIDRELQKTVSFTGTQTVPLQDQAMGESMGLIADRTKEHLAPSDQMVARTRRCILKAIHEFGASGAVPPNPTDRFTGESIRSGSVLEEAGVSWEEVYEKHLKTAAHP